MKILAINGSPHKGNTYKRVEHFGELVSRHDDVEFEHLMLKDLNLEPCGGCFLCFHKGERTCPHKDDLESVRQKIEEADAVVFATPVYSMHVSYLLKSLIDRMAYTFHRPRYFRKYAIGCAVAGSIGQKPTLSYIREVAAGWGFEYAGNLSYSDPPESMGIPSITGGEDPAEAIADKLVALIRIGKPGKPGFKDSFSFQVMRAVYSRMGKYSPVDYAYWKEKGWLKRGAKWYIKEISPGLPAVLYGRIMGWFIGKMIDREFARFEKQEKQDEEV